MKCIVGPEVVRTNIPVRLSIGWMACIPGIFQMPYRQMEGFIMALSKKLPGLQSAGYTTLFRRIQRMPFVIPDIPE